MLLFCMTLWIGKLPIKAVLHHLLTSTLLFQLSQLLEFLLHFDRHNRLIYVFIDIVFATDSS